MFRMTRPPTDGAADRVWLWRSGADHRLSSVQLLQGAPSAGSDPGTLPAALWERCATDDPEALRARLDAAQPIEALPVRFAGLAAEGRAGLLDGRALRDADGRFAGYHGTFREDTGAAGPGPAPKPPSAPDSDFFTHAISHDLRAPIRVIEGFTKIIKEDYGPLLDRVGNDHLERVLGAATRLSGMIDALLALSKLSSQPLTPQSVNLSQLAGCVADDLRRSAPTREVEIAIEPGLQALGDPAMLRTLLDSLLGNAWKYTAKTPQGRIDFGRHAHLPDTFTVQDNGAGFDMRFADRLFGVFHRLHSASDYPGAGVGLAAARRIVGRHGGTVWAEGEVHRGARFHFSLPRGGTAPV
jgi:signal transduction histidine kinase